MEIKYYIRYKESNGWASRIVEKTISAYDIVDAMGKIENECAYNYSKCDILEVRDLRYENSN